MKQPSRRARIFDLIFLILLAMGMLLVAHNRYAISDWWFLRSYIPGADSVRLADDAGLNENGRSLLYRGDPQLAAKSQIDQVCGEGDLGCITNDGTIYILQDDGGRYHDETVVTAAHEMLHAAYRRLSKQRREQVNAWLESERLNLSDPRLDKALDNPSDASEPNDELHSLIGTEYAHLSSDLESYYHKYFNDRSKITAAYTRSQ